MTHSSEAMRIRTCCRVVRTHTLHKRILKEFMDRTLLEQPKAAKSGVDTTTEACKPPILVSDSGGLLGRATGHSYPRGKGEPDEESEVSRIRRIGENLWRSHMTNAGEKCDYTPTDGEIWSKLDEGFIYKKTQHGKTKGSSVTEQPRATKQNKKAWNCNTPPPADRTAASITTAIWMLLNSYFWQSLAENADLSITATLAIAALLLGNLCMHRRWHRATEDTPLEHIAPSISSLSASIILSAGISMVAIIMIISDGTSCNSRTNTGQCHKRNIVGFHEGMDTNKPYLHVHTTDGSADCGC